MRLLHLFNFTALFALFALAACSSDSGRQTAADSNPSGMGFPSTRTVDVAVASHDVAVASHEGLQVWLGQGQGRFKASAQGFLTLPGTTGVALGDLDGDGDLDLFVTHENALQN